MKYIFHGILVSTSSYKVHVKDLPPKVTAALKSWVPHASWDRPAEARKERDEPYKYKVEARIDGKTYKAELHETGAFIKRDALPASSKE